MVRVADVFVSRLDPQLIACDLQNYYLMGKLHVEVDVERVKVTEYLIPVHVYSQCSQPNLFMSADVWPEGAYVRSWGRPGLSSGIRIAIITDLRFFSSELQLHSHDGKQFNSTILSRS